MQTTSDTPPMLSALVATAPVRTLTVSETIRVVQERVVIRPQAVTTTHVAVPPAEWEWEHLRDYVVGQIQRVVGVFPRQAPYKEAAIFKGFLARWGSRSSGIAQYAFEVAGGYWKGAPISVNRFCKASDDYFAAEIVRHLDEVAAAKSARA